MHCAFKCYTIERNGRIDQLVSDSFCFFLIYYTVFYSFLKKKFIHFHTFLYRFRKLLTTSFFFVLQFSTIMGIFVLSICYFFCFHLYTLLDYAKLAFNYLYILCYSTIVLGTHDQSLALSCTTIHGFYNINQLLLVVDGKIQLVIVTGTKIN